MIFKNIDYKCSNCGKTGVLSINRENHIGDYCCRSCGYFNLVESKNIKDTLFNLAKNQKDLDPRINQIVDDNFEYLLGVDPNEQLINNLGRLEEY